MDAMKAKRQVPAARKVEMIEECPFAGTVEVRGKVKAGPVTDVSGLCGRSDQVLVHMKPALTFADVAAFDKEPHEQQ